MMNSLKSELGSQFTDEIEESWNLALEEIAKMVSKPEDQR